MACRCRTLGPLGSKEPMSISPGVASQAAASAPATCTCLIGICRAGRRGGSCSHTSSGTATGEGRIRIPGRGGPGSLCGRTVGSTKSGLALCSGRVSATEYGGPERRAAARSASGWALRPKRSSSVSPLVSRPARKGSRLPLRPGQRLTLVITPARICRIYLP